MTIRRLEDFARSIGLAFGLAHRQTRGGAEARVTSMDVDLAATVEHIGAKEAAATGAEPGALALRVGQPANRPRQHQKEFLRLSIGVRDGRGEQIEVRLEGTLLGRYGRATKGGKTIDGEKS